MHEYHYIRYHFVQRSDCTYIIYHGPLLKAYHIGIIVMFYLKPSEIPKKAHYWSPERGARFPDKGTPFFLSCEIELLVENTFGAP